MQTFLPYPNFMESAKVMDKKRCWKQVVEAKQIIDCLEHNGYTLNGQQMITHLETKRQMGWANHPAVKMWEGYPIALKEYFNAFLDISERVHKINTKYEPYEVYEGANYPDGYPWWLGQEQFHRAMRARLIEKDTEFYLPKFPNDKGYNDGKYWWPVMETKTFRII